MTAPTTKQQQPQTSTTPTKIPIQVSQAHDGALEGDAEADGDALG